MPKVVGSSPFIRFIESPAQGFFVASICTEGTPRSPLGPSRAHSSAWSKASSGGLASRSQRFAARAYDDNRRGVVFGSIPVRRRSAEASARSGTAISSRSDQSPPSAR
jgi:hypothetical protein